MGISTVGFCILRWSGAERFAVVVPLTSCPLLIVGQLPDFEAPQLDHIDDGAIVGDGDVVGFLKSVAVEGGDEGALVDVEDEALRLLPVQHFEGLRAAHGIDPPACGCIVTSHSMYIVLESRKG